jgi:hypothetical protein
MNLQHNDWRFGTMAIVFVLLILVCAYSAFGESPTPASMTKVAQIGPRLDNVNFEDYAHVLYVSSTIGSDDSEGSIEKPLKTLETALAGIGDASPTNRYAVFVSAGRYRVIRLGMKPDVDLYGSFAAGNWEQRDVYQRPSILDATGDGPVVIGADRSRLDGFQITGGKHDGSGGAIICQGVALAISNNVITGNCTIHSPSIELETLHIVGHEGGAIAVLGGSTATIENNLIYDNRTDVGDGGGIVVRGRSNPTISRNVIVGNLTGLTDTTMYDGNVGSRSSNGAGISVSDTCAPEISANIIVLNKAHHTNDGGGIYIEFEAAPYIHGNWLVGNTTSDDGGAIYVRGLPDNTSPKGNGPLIEGNIFAGNRIYHIGRERDYFDEAIFLSKGGRATIRGNLFTGQGSAVGNANSVMTLENNTIVNNSGDGVYVDLRVENVPLSTVTGNVIWGNGGEQYTTVRTLSPVPKVVDNVIQGGYEGEGNRDEEPQFLADSIGATILERTIDVFRCRTTIKVPDGLPKTSLAGRPIQVGRQWSVIHSSTENQLSVWGEISDPNDHLFIPSTFTPR